MTFGIKSTFFIPQSDNPRSIFRAIDFVILAWNYQLAVRVHKAIFPIFLDFGKTIIAPDFIKRNRSLFSIKID